MWSPSEPMHTFAHLRARAWLALGRLALFGALCLVHARGAELFDNPVIARGRGFEIRQAELDDTLTALKGTLATQGQTIARQDEPALRARLLERMILTRILVQRASEEDKARARELADKFIADTKKKAPSEESYRRQLIATGLKPEVFEARAHEQALVEKVIERELKSKLTVADADVRAFYETGDDLHTRELRETIRKLETAGNQDTVFYRDATNRLDLMRRSNLARLTRPEQVTADLILFYTLDPITRVPLSEEAQKAKLARATNTLARLRAGEDFEKVAREVSEDPDVARTGGRYLATADTPMAPELKEALFSLPPEQLSNPIATALGYYLARVRERKPAIKLPFEQVEADIRDLLLAQMVEKQLPGYAEALRKEYDVVIEDPSLRPGGEK